MEDDQQFCLRWNNHQSTLIQNFDTLLESGTLVDCTLAAEGKYLKAHKVVLSACSPYFEGLLSEHYDKHPVFILKDVKFKELKAMMEYMYRGEVNISQEQLTALLKAAESLQIKGLSDNRTGGASSMSSTTTSKAENTRSSKQAATATASSAVAASASTVAADIPPHASSGLTIEKNSKVPRSSLSQVSVSDLPESSASPQLRGLSSREGSQSPTRRRKRTRRRSLGNEDTTGSIDNNHDASNSSDLTAPALVAPVAEDKSHADQADPIGRSALMQQLTKPPTEEMMQMSHEKAEPTEEMIQPKSEYMDDQESVEDLTNLDDDMNDLRELDEQESTRPGPSHDPSQHGGVQPWHMGGDRSNPGVGAAAIPPGQQDEVFLAAHDAAQAQRDSQAMYAEEILVDVNEPSDPLYQPYGHKPVHHPSEAPRAQHPSPSSPSKKYLCSKCKRSFKVQTSLYRHTRYECNQSPRFACVYCNYRTKQTTSVYQHVKRLHSGQEEHCLDIVRGVLVKRRPFNESQKSLSNGDSN
ncbi:longitudinals lacking protein, isoforms N/O/W/X/Y isoform X4 [Copidosoma floridanum]|uniref:longitudinals lacking protein, isoforms N/O/W/X/Y isoform X4 n=1 Tax=Copidosoma floridanum TaxID=29053 RepID=UPI0006C9E4E9|nr:longitudinals lacking protein, isoforms N/O/W/X/Y isoform X4 [Copidosoma floridanum]